MGKKNKIKQSASNEVNNTLWKELFDIFQEIKELDSILPPFETLRFLIEQIAGAANEFRPKNSPEIDFEWLHSLTDDQFSKKREKYAENIFLGAFVAALIAKGSSRNQAIPALSKWMLCSETTVRNALDAYKAFTPGKGGFDEWNEAYLWLLNNYQRFSAFPLEYPKAHKAMMTIANECIAWAKTAPKDESGDINIGMCFPRIPLSAIERIKKKDGRG